MAGKGKCMLDCLKKLINNSFIFLSDEYYFLLPQNHFLISQNKLAFNTGQ